MRQCLNNFPLFIRAANPQQPKRFFKEILLAINLPCDISSYGNSWSRVVEVFVFISKFERIARYVMSGIALLALLTWAAFELGWVATMPSYKNEAWYLVGGNTQFIIASEYTDEAACRRNENTSAVCLQGKVLAEEAQRRQAGS